MWILGSFGLMELCYISNSKVLLCITLNTVLNAKSWFTFTISTSVLSHS